MESTRSLATVRRIDNLIPIAEADRIELAVVGGWKVIVKKNEYKVNDLVVYLEIDSWVPHSVAPFLTKSGNYPKLYKGVEGQRLKTVKMKGVLSQGLILPFSVLNAKQDGIIYESLADEGSDVTEILNILKWEKEIPAQLAGIQKGSFPSAIPKTDQERVQNLTKKLNEYASEHLWEVTEKLDGSSCTFYLTREGEFNVCSRNVNLKEVEGNSFWDIARKYDVENAMKNAGMYGFAIQGELVGPGIQGNQYELSEIDFYVFDMYSTHDGSYCPPYYRVSLAEKLGLNHVPVIYNAWNISNEVNALLQLAEGTSRLNSSNREGLVFKSITDPAISFKAISNSWLMENEIKWELETNESD